MLLATTTAMPATLQGAAAVKSRFLQHLRILPADASVFVDDIEPASMQGGSGFGLEYIVLPRSLFKQLQAEGVDLPDLRLTGTMIYLGSVGQVRARLGDKPFPTNILINVASLAAGFGLGYAVFGRK